MVPNDADLANVRRYFAALRRAQADIDVSHQPYAHYYARELPERHRALVDVRRFGPGERFVFEPYTRGMYDSTRAWIDARGIFSEPKALTAVYEDAVIRL